ncbi:hypothetical protein GSI_09668 [Ganoderma sinense ZZ0214-1]|uniref:F-box domain-containing protein n=1 Tax=Ganoderma sinense ZZ0214-1 TaxID=1077348 RepID=A0A2G8S3A6_9APHY|nr:hypothetical protein GSI_09668 [Ganoderma sinense ZZ0214-1]
MSMKDVKRALPDLFKLASHSLESLTILDLDVFSFRPPELKAMLDSLPRLRELEMSGVQKKYQNALTDTLPHLCTLILAFYDDDTDTRPFLWTPHGAPNLQTLTLYNGTLPAKEDTSLTFPAVHTLRVCPRLFPDDVDACTRIFPNVRHATLDFPEGYGALSPAFRMDMRTYRPGMAWPDPSVQAWRASFLVRVQTAEHRGPDAWPHLQSVRAAGRDAWNLGWAGLARGVARLEMACGQWSWREQAPGAPGGQRTLAGVLGELRPGCVVFHPSAFDSPYTRRVFRWPQLLALQDAPGVRRLAMVFCEMVGRGYVCRAVWPRQLREVLEKTAVSSLLIRLDYAYPASQERSDLFERWRAGLLGVTSALRVVLFQVQSEAVLGWAKEERAGGIIWKEMDEYTKRKFLASENISPASVEPCDWCERRARH